MSTDNIRHGGGLAEACARFGGVPEDWLDLSTGINPVPVSLPDIAASAWQRLPDADLHRAALEAAQAFYGVAPGVPPLPVPGTQAAIQRLPALVGDGARVAVIGPTYGEYALVFRRAGFDVDVVSAIADVNDAYQVAVVVNPNNPDGRVVARADLLALADRMAGRGGLLVVDEAFADADPAEALASDAGRNGLIVFRSFGKFFGLAGLRLGFVLGREDELNRMARALGPWAVSGPALAIASAVMRDAEGLARLRRSIAERNAATRRVLEEAELEVRGGTSLFFLVEHPRAGDFHDALCRRHILVRTFDYRRDWLRIGLSSDAASDRRFAEALAAAAPIVSGSRVAWDGPNGRRISRA